MIRFRLKSQTIVLPSGQDLRAPADRFAGEKARAGRRKRWWHVLSRRGKSRPVIVEEVKHVR